MHNNKKELVELLEEAIGKHPSIVYGNIKSSQPLDDQNLHIWLIDWIPRIKRALDDYKREENHEG